MTDSERPVRHQCGALRRVGFLVFAVLIVACGSSTDAAPGMTGVWSGQIAYLTPNDSFTFYLTQDGAEVEGWGFMRPAGSQGAATFGGRGTLFNGQLDLSFLDLRSIQTGLGPAAGYFLRGSLDHGQMNATFGFDGSDGSPAVEHPISLRRFRPAASDLAGTWVLTSTPSGPVQPGSRDTIIANGDGRAWRHREVYPFGSSGGPATWTPIGTRAIWSRRGDWLVIDHEEPELSQDSLLIQSGELRRMNPAGTLTDHYTRVSTAAVLPCLYC